MKRRCLYYFETDSMGEGLRRTQEALKSFSLELHQASALPGGKYLFLAFSDLGGGATEKSYEEWLRLSGDSVRGGVLTDIKDDLRQALLHTQGTAELDVKGLLVMEGKSPAAILELTHQVLGLLKSGALYQLSLGRGFAGHCFSLLTLSEKCLGESKKVKSSRDVQVTLVENLHPGWVDDFLD